MNLKKNNLSTSWGKIKIYKYPLPERIIYLWIFFYNTLSLIAFAILDLGELVIWEKFALIGFGSLACYFIVTILGDYICLNDKDNKLIIRERFFKKREFLLENLTDIRVVDLEGCKDFVIEFLFDNSPKYVVKSWGESVTKEIIYNKHVRQRKRLNEFIEKWTYLYVYSK